MGAAEMDGISKLQSKVVPCVLRCGTKRSAGQKPDVRKASQQSGDTLRLPGKSDDPIQRIGEGDRLGRGRCSFGAFLRRASAKEE